MRAVHVVDSHTEGEPTRVVVSGGPDLGSGSAADRLRRFREEFDWFRTGVLLEPRGADVLVGALLFESDRDDCDAGVIFFNNTGYLQMCGHGTIGLARTLVHLGRVDPQRKQEVRIETAVGVVAARFEPDGRVAVDNVESWRFRTDVPVQLAGGQTVHGDIAWGGNWFFLVSDHGQDLSPGRVDALTEYAESIRAALLAEQISGEAGGEIDHIELFGPPRLEGNQSRNFVLCPGGEYDRSPCGTGTSAKLACLAASGKLAPGEIWRQESIVGTHFTASYCTSENGGILPTVAGRAFITAESQLLFEEGDPFASGICRGTLN